MATKPFAVIAGVGPGTVSPYLPPAELTLQAHSIPFHKSLPNLTASQGASIARKFAQAYSVVVLARNPSNYNGVVDEINSSGGQALGISADVSDSASVQSAFEKISQQYKDTPLAAAVFNSGGGFVRKPFLELTEEEFAGGFKSQGCAFPHLIFTRLV